MAATGKSEAGFASEIDRELLEIFGAGIPGMSSAVKSEKKAALAAALSEPFEGKAADLGSRHSDSGLQAAPPTLPEGNGRGAFLVIGGSSRKDAEAAAGAVTAAIESLLSNSAKGFDPETLPDTLDRLVLAMGPSDAASSRIFHMAVFEGLAKALKKSRAGAMPSASAISRSARLLVDGGADPFGSLQDGFFTSDIVTERPEWFLASRSDPLSRPHPTSASPFAVLCDSDSQPVRAMAIESAFSVPSQSHPPLVIRTLLKSHPDAFLSYAARNPKVLDEHESLACAAFAFHDAQGGLAQGQGEGVSRHANFS